MGDRGGEVAAGAVAHLGRLYRYAFRLCGSREAALDAVQEAVARALERASSYDPSRPVLPWLLALVRHEVVDRLRAFDPLRLAESVDACPPTSSGAEPAETVGRMEEAAMLDAALASLPVEQRSALILFHVEGLTLNEVAEVEGVPVGTVKSRLHRGREALADMLAGTGSRKEASGSG